MSEHEILREPGITTLQALTYLGEDKNQCVRDAYRSACTRVASSLGGRRELPEQVDGGE
jgi:hypothetical protein